MGVRIPPWASIVFSKVSQMRAWNPYDKVPPTPEPVEVPWAAVLTLLGGVAVLFLMIHFT